MSEFMPHYAPVVVLWRCPPLFVLRKARWGRGADDCRWIFRHSLRRSDLASPTPRISSSMSPGMLAGSGSPSRRTTQKPGWSSGTKTASFTRRFTLGLIPQHH